MAGARASGASGAGSSADLYRPAPRAPVSGEPAERAGLPLTDFGRARRVMAVFGDDLLFCPELGWGVWQADHFEFGPLAPILTEKVFAMLPLLLEEEAKAARAAPIPELEVQRRVKEALAAGSRRRIEGLRKDDPADVQRAAVEPVMRHERYAKLMAAAEKADNVGPQENAMKAARQLALVPFASLNADPWKLAVPNGTLDLRRAAEPAPEAEDPDERHERMRTWLRTHDRAMRPTRVAGCPFDPAAEAPRWRAFVDLITAKPDFTPDPEMSAYLKRCCGKLLLGVNDPPVALLFQGEGANGKSTLTDILRDVLGTYAARVPIAMFLDQGQDRESAAAAPDEVRLPGVRCYLGSEPKWGAKLSDAKIKQFAGGEERISRPNYGEFFEWEPSGTPVLSFNPMPKVVGADHGTTRRLVFLPFRVRLDALPEGKRKSREDALAEFREELSGVLNWLLEGLAEMRAIGLAPPKEAQMFKDAMLADSDPVGNFIEACFTPDIPGRVPLKTFVEAFDRWCDDNSQRKIGRNNVASQLRIKGWKVDVAKGRNVVYGLVWKPDDDVQALRRKAEGGGEWEREP